ncbi:MAG: DUF2807 domain-containing protein [Flavobacteriales bacterium]|nr:DUF2807 domain-containing protein [Flavobacteriales bacterium]MBP7407301.1 DUF2807 domain-containing protein [Flavobacteriales bacterium]
MRTLIALAASAVIVVLATSACVLNHDHVKGVGEPIKKPLAVEPFHGIEVNGSMDVEIVTADVQAVEVEAQANIAELLTTVVKNGTWIVSTSKSYSTDKPFTIRIRVPSMDLVHINGSGDVKSTDIFEAEKVDLAISGSGGIQFAVKATSVRAAIDGSGDIRMTGSCSKLSAAIAGSGDVKASELVTADLSVDIAGSGDVSANASGAVNVAIAGSGDVVLMKKPASIKESIAGSGEVRIAK